MKNVPGKVWHGSAVSVHGPALRHIRQLTGLTTAQLADEVQITRDYLRKVELGFNRGVAPDVYARLCLALRIDDKRVLLADPTWPGTQDRLPLDTVDTSTEDAEAPPPPRQAEPPPRFARLADQIAAGVQAVITRDTTEHAS